MNDSSSPERTLHELTLGDALSLEDLVNREALGEMAAAFRDLFGVSLRVYSVRGGLLADASQPVEIYDYLDQDSAACTRVAESIATVKSLQPELNASELYECFTGACYRVVGVAHDGRVLGRIVIGPYVRTAVDEPSESLRAACSQLEVAVAWDALLSLPRLDTRESERLGVFLTRALDLMLFSGYRALLTSSMHMASVKESYRELQEKNAHLQQAFDRLRELDRLKSNFLATVSHELRTPLTSIIGYSEMLAAGIAGDVSEEQREFVDTIRGKGEQLLELIKGLLDLSKLESGTMSLRKADLDVAELVRDVAETLMPSARKKGIDLVVEVAAALPLLWGDVNRLRQVLLNLSENAMKFTASGGKVTLAARATSMEEADLEEELGPALLVSARRRAVEVRVADTGIGIPERERSRVFDSFYQVDSSSTREQGGTGLGLSIVKRLIDGHDGSVSIESNHPHGTVFVVLLPCRTATG